MEYKDIVLKVRENIENADARDIFEHIAVQVDIEGEGSGAFYVEVADRKVAVEPYDYVDRDGRVFADGETLIAIAEGRLSISDAIKNGVLRAEGNHDKLALLNKIKIKKAKKTAKTADKPKSAAKEAKAEVKTAAKEAKAGAKTAAKEAKAEVKTAAKEAKADVKTAAKDAKADAKTAAKDAKAEA